MKSDYGVAGRSELNRIRIHRIGKFSTVQSRAGTHDGIDPREPVSRQAWLDIREVRFALST